MKKYVHAQALLSLGIVFWGLLFLPCHSIAAEQSQDITTIVDKIVLGSPSQAESENAQDGNAEADTLLLQEKNAEYRILQEKNRMTLLILILSSTPILLGLVLYCMKNSPQCSEESFLNAIGLVLVIEGTMFTAVSAATTEQLTAPIGILGAIAGYLFGAAKRRANEKT